MWRWTHGRLGCLSQPRDHADRMEGNGDQDLFRHQLITFLTKQGIIRATLQLLGGHTTERTLAIYHDLMLSA
jgi:hypothetical protein